MRPFYAAQRPRRAALKKARSAAAQAVTNAVLGAGCGLTEFQEPHRIFADSLVPGFQKLV